MADPSAVSIVIPAFDESSAIGDIVASLRAAAAWHDVIVVDDGSSDATGSRAEQAGARVIRHPYNKGNGAAVNRLAGDRALAARLGNAGLQRARAVTWDGVVEQLLG